MFAQSAQTEGRDVCCRIRLILTLSISILCMSRDAAPMLPSGGVMCACAVVRNQLALPNTPYSSRSEEGRTPPVLTSHACVLCCCSLSARRDV